MRGRMILGVDPDPTIGEAFDNWHAAIIVQLLHFWKNFNSRHHPVTMVPHPAAPLPYLHHRHPHSRRTGCRINRIQQGTRRDVTVASRGLDLRVSEQLLHHIQAVIGVDQEAGK